MVRRDAYDEVVLRNKGNLIGLGGDVEVEDGAPPLIRSAPAHPMVALIGLAPPLESMYLSFCHSPLP